ncbi:hypothetical protein ASC66_08920 [Leifsonia sp. Root4]|uniref:hypothetical protein n=1 Tax=Leifsonia sp. Root4 TaxID=1736525 RepID=UPI0006FE77AE|nr:hypothetical protein [Leifsonia sp. Root4]KQW06576.1 hypothetical protein ASC66_08920 [Leifsonia sp. Root4]
MSTTIDVNASVDRTYAFWNRVGSSEGTEPSSGETTQWTVLVNGVPNPQTSPVSAKLSRVIPLERVQGDEARGEVTFDALGDQRTRVAISLEWQRDDSAQSYVPLILIDGVQVHTNLRDFKREVEREAGESRDWHGTVNRFEAL